ncbi:MAG: TRL domain-containing protein [Spirochaetota bacterium]
MYFKWFLILLFIVTMQSCVSSPLLGLFVYTKQHVYHQSNGGQLSSAKIEKSGESCSHSSAFGYLFLFYYGAGGSIEQAKEKAGITKVAVIDRSSLAIGPLYYRDCILVWGE